MENGFKKKKEEDGESFSFVANIRKKVEIDK